MRNSWVIKLATFSPLSWHLTWLLFWFIIITTDVFWAWNSDTNMQELPIIAGLNLFFLVSILGTGYCSIQIKNFYPTLKHFISYPEQELSEWYQNEYRLAYQSIGQLIFALLFANATILVLTNSLQSITSNASLYWFRIIYMWFGLFWVGMGVWALIVITLTGVKLSQFPIKMTTYLHPKISVMALGRLFFRMTFAVVAAYSSVVITLLISINSGLLTLSLDHGFILVFMTMGAVATFFFFLIPQIGFHKSMKREKERRIIAFSIHLEMALEKATTNPTDENINKLNELLQLQQHLSDMHEWPFNQQAIWSVISALILPLILLYLEITMG